MTLSRWLHKALNRTATKSAPRLPLLVEQLEDRTVPSLTYLGGELQVGGTSETSVPAADNPVLGVAMDSAGNSIVVWPDGGIMGQRYDANGVANGGAFVIQPAVQFRLDQVSAAMDAAGNFIAAWHSYDDNTVDARLFNAAGVAQGSAFVVAPLPNTPYTPEPSVVITPTGFAIFWNNEDSILHGKRYDAAGNLLGTIAVTEGQTVDRPRAAVDASGNFVVAYDSADHFAADGQVFAQRLDAAGNTLGGPIRLSKTSGTSNLSPVVAAQPGGAFAVAWVNLGDATGAVDSAQGAYVRVFSANGTAQGDSLAIDPSAGRSTTPAIAMDSSGNFVVAWDVSGAGSAQLFGPTGAPAGTRFNIRAAHDAAQPIDASSPSGNRILIAFLDGPLGSNNKIPIGADLAAAGPNHAPVVDTNVTPAFTYVKQNDPNPPGDTVASVFGPAISDADLGAFQGVAVTGTTGTSNGTWQFSLDGGTTWNDFNAVADSAALLVRGPDRIRFLPNNGFLGNPTLTFHAWDQTSGTAGSAADLTQAGSTGGQTAFSTAAGTANLFVTPTGNYAPVLDTTYAAHLSDIAVNSAAPPGNTVAQIVGPSITDRNPGALQGIVVTAVTGAADGTWQYSLDAGTTWTAIPVASLSATSALLLRSTDMVRFVPNAEFTGTVSIAYRAWDQTTGTAGSLADSTVVDPVVGAAGAAFSAAGTTAAATVSRFILTVSNQFGTLEVYGTAGNDNFLYVPGGDVTLNGETHTYPVGFFLNGTSLFGLTINFHGNGGTDTASVDMRQTAVTEDGVYLWGNSTIADGFASLSKQPFLVFTRQAFIYDVNLYNVANIYISGDSGDIVTITGSASGPNTYVSTPTYSYFSAPNRFDVVSGVGGSSMFRTLGAVYAYANHSASDNAYFYFAGASGLDAFVASGSAYSYMSGTGFYNVAVGFGDVQAFSKGSQDIAYFLDSPNNDVFYGAPGSCYMSGPSFLNAAAGFALIYAESFVGGTDVAYNRDQAHIITGGFAIVYYS